MKKRNIPKSLWRKKCKRCGASIVLIGGHAVEIISLNQWENRFLSIGGEIDYNHKRHELHLCNNINKDNQNETV